MQKTTTTTTSSGLGAAATRPLTSFFAPKPPSSHLKLNSNSNPNPNPNPSAKASAQVKEKENAAKNRQPSKSSETMIVGKEECAKAKDAAPLSSLAVEVAGWNCADDVVSFAKELSEELKERLRTIVTSVNEQFKLRAASDSGNIKVNAKAAAEDGEKKSIAIQRDAFAVMPSIAVNVPRGSFELRFCVGGIEMRHKSIGTLWLAAENVFRILLLPTFDRLKKMDVHKMLVVLRDPIKVRKSTSRFFLFAPKTSKEDASVAIENSHDNIPIASPLKGQPCEILQKLALFSLKKDSIVSAGEGGAEVFASSTSKCYIKAYHNVNDGLLYLTGAGIVFVQKPIVHVSVEEIASIDMARGGSSMNRTFDLDILCEDGTQHQFRMIDREEQGPLMQYAMWLQRKKAVMLEAKAGKGNGDEDVQGDECDEDDDSDQDDSDFCSDDEESSSSEDESDDAEDEHDGASGTDDEGEDGNDNGGGKEEEEEEEEEDTEDEDGIDGMYEDAAPASKRAKIE